MKEPKPNRVVSPAAAETAPGKSIQRWSAARKRDVVLRLLRDESVEAVSRQIGIERR
jgi:transposase